MKRYEVAHHCPCGGPLRTLILRDPTIGHLKIMACVQCAVVIPPSPPPRQRA